MTGDALGKFIDMDDNFHNIFSFSMACILAKMYLWQGIYESIDLVVEGRSYTQPFNKKG